MTNDLDEATTDAQRMATAFRAHAANIPEDQLETVYVFEGCDCREQGGTAYRYHIHHFNRAGYERWFGTHQYLQTVAQYPGY